MILVIMGVAGSGKTTVGELLAAELGWEFIEGDRLHPAVNVEKMRAGEALTEADRAAWFAQIEEQVKETSKTTKSVVLAASALRHSHRDLIRASGTDVQFVYLRGDYVLIKSRLQQRSDHFFGPDLLKSQFDALEEPESAIVFDISMEPEEIVQQIRRALAI